MKWRNKKASRSALSLSHSYLGDLKVGISIACEVPHVKALVEENLGCKCVGYNAAGSPSVALSFEVFAPTAKGSRPVARPNEGLVRGAGVQLRSNRTASLANRSSRCLHLPTRSLTCPPEGVETGEERRVGVGQSISVQYGLPMKTRSAEAPPAFSRRVFRDRVTVSPAHGLSDTFQAEKPTSSGFTVVCCTCVGCSPDRAM